MRPAQRFIFLSIFIFVAWYLFLRSPAAKVAIPVEPRDDLPPTVAKFVKKKLNKARPITFTIADEFSLDNLHNIREKLLPWGRASNYVVLCLDEPCMKMNAGGIKRIDVSMVRGGRGTVLILFALYLIENNYSFLHVDSDICITGTHDIFSRTLKQIDDSWDVQFMEENDKLDPGFWMSRPSAGTLAYLRATEALLKDPKNKGVSATYLLREGIRGLSLRYHLLDAKDFKSWADYQAWESQNFATEPQIDVLIQGTTAIHFTCIDKSIRPYFGKLFGGWSDYNGYYSNIRGRYLMVSGISGDKDQVINFIALAIQLAIDSGRILILPYHVEIIQRQMKKVGPDTIPEYKRIPTFPFYRVVDILSLNGVVDYVEASFALNREKFTGNEVSLDTLVLDEGMLELEKGAGYPKLVTRVRQQSGAAALSIEFQGFDVRNAAGFERGVKDYVKTIREKLRICRNIDEKETACEKRCT
ncbi:uncharacterized protein DFL_008306 [Arthrobotrys flagrans]|uniref:Nucleotide-diphospho-sugar transferase domain-containing protein n=1 Tax=Arthrobotrys flagrans TaxID=97331 RepID=A0A436ZNC5_ARTFL|nr:hypothetical protein DFL_008306 [Arthrobotrys flagrans]